MIRNEIIKIAESQIGVSEEPENSNLTTYGAWFGLNGVAWCGQFVSWVYDRAGKNLGRIGYMKGFAGCQTAVIHFRNKKQTTTNPQSGDIVFYDWNGDGRSDHTGIFIKWTGLKDGEFEAIEGNTSLANQSNGGQVMRRFRHLKNVLVFANPLQLPA
jgi:hypothetical protein